MLVTDSVAAATKLAPLVNGTRLRLARESLGWTQGKLADRVGETGHVISAAAISQLEKDKTRPSGRTLAAIAAVTGFPSDYFIGRVDDVDPPGFFRSLRSAPAYVRKTALARAHHVHDLIDAVEHHVELPDFDVPNLAVDPDTITFDEIEDVADRVRRMWGLDYDPIPNMVRQLERHGVVACRLALDRNDLDAFSVRFQDRAIVVLSQDKRTLTRSRFDAAHELGHLVLGHTERHAGQKHAELQAHRFAAAFLMPNDGIYDELPATADWQELLDLKAEWRVSLGALLMRARTLGKLHPNRYESAMKYMSARGWRTQEPGERELGPPEQPRLLRAAVELAMDGGELTLDELAASAALPLDVVRELIGDSTPDRLLRPRLQI